MKKVYVRRSAVPISPRRRRYRRTGPNPLIGFLLVVSCGLIAWLHFTPHTATSARARSDSAITSAATAAAPTPTSTPVPTAPAVIVAVATPTAAPTATPTPPYVYQESWLRKHPAQHPPQLTAKSAIVVDYDTRRVLYALHEHDRRAQASTTKIMTADVALDTAPLTTRIKITKDAVATEPDHMGVQLNEVLTLKELLYGMLLDSGNDAAYAIADGLGGQKAFVAKMNAKARELQLHDTHFANPAGFDDPHHYTSAYDLVVQATDTLTRHPIFRTIVSTKKKIIESSKTHGWFGPTNLNSLLWDYPGAFGIKPGLTANSGYCLVAAATRNGHTVIAVVLGVPTNRHFTEGRLLLDYGFKRIGEEQPTSTAH